MPFEKGNNIGKGRPKGKENKNKRRFIVALQDMFENNEDKIAGWLDQIAKDDPKEALNQLNKWAEFCFPKLNRTELTGDKDNPLEIKSIIIEHVKTENKDTQ